MSHYDLFTENQKRPKSGGESNRYRFLRKLGEGTYAVVYLSEFNHVSNHKAPNRMACKVIDTMKAPREYITKFLPRELDILRRLDHPHIIRVNAIYQENSKYLIFMRFAENGDLLDFLVKSGAVVEAQARMWLKQIALALQYLHELEIAHRDLKCENILVTANFNLKLADFGFARMVLNKKGVRLLSTTYCGSSSYCAPEILKGIPYNPKVSDIWSLGVVVFVMLNKAMPFDSVHIKKLYEQQITRKWRFRPSIETSISSQVKNLLYNMLEPSTQKRYTVSEVLNSEWIYMDKGLIGLSEEESLALIEAKEQRRKMDEYLFSAKQQALKDKRMKERQAFRV